jgi:hypothetical protein
MSNNACSFDVTPRSLLLEFPIEAIAGLWDGEGDLRERVTYALLLPAFIASSVLVGFALLIDGRAKWLVPALLSAVVNTAMACASAYESMRQLIRWEPHRAARE